MSKATHTPGPWKFKRHTGVVDCRGERILVDGVALPTGNHPRIGEAEANACLIAAAPDLLDALTRLCRSVETWDREGTVYRSFAEPLTQAHAAIRKATGG